MKIFANTLNQRTGLRPLTPMCSTQLGGRGRDDTRHRGLTSFAQHLTLEAAWDLLGYPLSWIGLPYMLGLRRAANVTSSL